MGLLNFIREKLPNGGVRVAPKVESPACWWNTGHRPPMPPVEMLQRKAVDLSDYNAEADGLLERAMGLCDALGVPALLETWDAMVGPAMTCLSFLPSPEARAADLRRLAKEAPLRFGRTDIRVVEIGEGGRCRMEFPHAKPASLSFGNLLSDPAVRAKTDEMELPWVMGQSADGSPMVVDLADDRASHVLIAGTPGAGKSVALTSMLSSFLSLRGPSHVRLVVLDVKRVEMAAWSGIGHLACKPALDSAACVKALAWVRDEMRFRYSLLEQFKRKDIKSYNRGPKPLRMPRLVIVCDELGNLILSEDGREAERLLVQLAQEGRAAGIHIVAATQRPASVSVPTRLRENLPARVALRTATALDSRMVLTRAGAEKLAGRGEFIANFAGQADFCRGQICWTPEADVAALCGYWRAERKPEAKP